MRVMGLSCQPSTPSGLHSTGLLWGEFRASCLCRALSSVFGWKVRGGGGGIGGESGEVKRPAQGPRLSGWRLPLAADHPLQPEGDSARASRCTRGRPLWPMTPPLPRVPGACGGGGGGGSAAAIHWGVQWGCDTPLDPNT